MSTDNTENLPATVDDIKSKAAALFSGEGNAFLEDANDHGVTEGGRLGFSGNTGIWKLGNDEISTGSQFVFLMTEAARGWMAWSNNKPIAFHWAKIAAREKLPAESELEDHWNGLPKGKRAKETDGWNYVVRIPVRDLNGGEQVDLTLAADSGYRPINKLLLKFGKEVKFHLDENGQPMMPLVEIDTESFDGKGGTKYAPVLQIVDWLSMSDMIELQSEVAEPNTVSGPDAKTAQLPAKKAAPAPEAKVAPVSKYRRERVGG